MSQALNVVKMLGSWGCLCAACVLMVLTKDTSLAMILGVLSIGFAQAPNA